MNFLRRTAVFGLTALSLTACGQSGPSTKDLQSLVDKVISTAKSQMAAQIAQANASSGDMGAGIAAGLQAAMGALPKVTVESAKCTARQNGVFACAVVENVNGQTAERDMNVIEASGAWVLVQLAQ